MQPTDLTVVILKGIREDLQSVYTEVRATNERLDAVKQRIESLRHGNDVGFERLERRQADAEARLARELVAFAAVVRDVRDLLRGDLAFRGRIEDHERRIVALEAAR